jgi:DNA-binding NarL/FixJ family response regulator
MSFDPARTTSVALVSTHRLATDLLAQWLSGSDLGFRIASHSDPATAIADKRPVDIVVLGNLLNIMEPSDVVAWIEARLARMPDIAVVVISDGEDGSHSVDCLRAGASGFIPTSLSLPVAFAALRLVLSGGIYIPAMALGLDPSRRQAPSEIQSRADVAPQEVTPPPEAVAATLADERQILAKQGLSPRESDILLLLKRGASNRMMAAELGISENTVMVHMRNVMRKLGATNRTQAVYAASRGRREE